MPEEIAARVQENFSYSDEIMAYMTADEIAALAFKMEIKVDREFYTWTGIGLFTKQKDPIAYCDYKQKSDTSIETGICLTIQKYRNHGYIQTLFQFLFDMYPEYSIRIGTYENNTAIIHCINRSGFQKEQRIADDRIDGTSTIYYVRKGEVTGGTEHHYALHENNGSGERYSVVE